MIPTEILLTIFLASVEDYDDFSIIDLDLDIMTASTYNFASESDLGVEWRKGLEYSELMKDHLSNKDIKDDVGDIKDLVVVNCPIAIPKMIGMDILEGPVNKQEVIQNLRNYHPYTLDWISMLSSNLVLPGSLKKDIPDISLPKSRDDDFFVEHCEIQGITLIRSNDHLSLYYKYKKRIMAEYP